MEFAVPDHPATIPRPRRGLSAAVLDFLMTRYDAKRPPDMASRLLATLVELDTRDQEYPSRRDMAEHLDASVFGIDAALSSAMRRGLIEPVVRTKPGHIARWENAVHAKYYKPTRTLKDAVSYIVRY